MTEMITTYTLWCRDCGCTFQTCDPPEAAVCPSCLVRKPEAGQRPFLPERAARLLKDWFDAHPLEEWFGDDPPRH